MIVLDTSVLIDALAGGAGGSRARLRGALERGERLLMPSLVLYEWLRGPRAPEELEAQEALFPAASALAFGADEAAVAARLYASVVRPRGSELDLAIAAHAVARDAELWTLNVEDFAGLPDLRLAEAVDR